MEAKVAMIVIVFTAHFSPTTRIQSYNLSYDVTFAQPMPERSACTVAALFAQSEEEIKKAELIGATFTWKCTDPSAAIN
ncbi:hypothetical protein KW798_03390 [Candidatus Parcubacteria bacterium]|nr:hypothetical protein [Candidatus Parcubacteria bacterium]